jgi:hypothetical protein
MDTLQTAPPRNSRLILGLGLLALFLFNVLLYAPLYSPDERPYRGSIAPGYAGITRFISEHPNPWGWNPQQYAGQPTQFSYPPLIPYAAATLHWISGMEPFQSYRSLIAFLACLGPVALAAAFYYFTRSLFWSLLAGFAYTFCSPAYGLFKSIDADRGLYYLPWRLLVLMKYGEGPHIAGLTMLPLILVAVHRATQRPGFRPLFLAAFAMALAPLTNWLSAFGLTVCILVYLVARPAGWKRVFLAGLLGYGLAAFWLTPDYVITTLFNWPKDSYGYQVEQSHWPLYLGLAGVLALIKLLMWRARAESFLQFTTLGFATFLWIAGGFYLYQRDTIPESRRYSLEFELFLFLAIFAWLYTAWRSKAGLDKGWVDKACVALAVLALAGACWPQAQKTYARTYESWGITDREKSLEYRLAKWLHDAKPQGRVFASGGLRFRLNAWFPIAQVGGTFESGLRERQAVTVFYQVRTGAASQPGEPESLDAIWQLAAMGTEYVVIHGPGSEEYYKDFKNPLKLINYAPVVHRLGEHDWIHKLPFRSLAFLVRPDELPVNFYKEALPPLYAAQTNPTRPQITFVEQTPSRYQIQGPVEPGFEISVLMNYDPGWRATQSGRDVPITRNNLGLIQLHPPPGDQPIVLDYAGTNQQRIFAAISLLVWSACLWRTLQSKRPH